MHRRVTISILSTVIAVLASLLGVGPTQAQSSAGPDAPLPDETISVASRHYAVKPIDGAVRERIRIQLGAPAEVRLRLRDSAGRYTRGPVRLGKLGAGTHYWTWTGHKNGGALAPDGHYMVSVNATFDRSGYTRWAYTEAYVHRHYHPGTGTSEFTTVYPWAKPFHDSTVLEYRFPDSVKPTVRIRNAEGRIVFTRAGKEFLPVSGYGVPARPTLRIRWDGRDGRDRPLPTGSYYATVSGVDRDGHSGSTRALRVKVAKGQLVLRTRSRTVSASFVQRVEPPDYGCNDCDYSPPCSTVTASERFPQEGARSYRSTTTEECAGKAYKAVATGGGKYVFDDPEARRYDTLSVSMFGGPTTPGAADRGELAVLYGATFEPFYPGNHQNGKWTSPSTATVSTGPDTREHITTTPTVPIGIVQDYDTGNAVPGFNWTFTTRDGASYDIATYTFTYTVLTPPR